MPQDPSMAGHRTVAPNEDPVCGMIVDIEASQAKSLATVHLDRKCLFCGEGCFLEFRDDPEAFVEPGYQPAM
jgi:YHS domain-containing protein